MIDHTITSWILGLHFDPALFEYIAQSRRGLLPAAYLVERRLREAFRLERKTSRTFSKPGVFL